MTDPWSLSPLQYSSTHFGAGPGLPAPFGAGPFGCDPPPPESPNPLSSPSGEVGRGGLQAPQLPLSVLLETFKRIKGLGACMGCLQGCVFSGGEDGILLSSIPSIQKGW